MREGLSKPWKDPTSDISQRRLGQAVCPQKNCCGSIWGLGRKSVDLMLSLGLRQKSEQMAVSLDEKKGKSAEICRGMERMHGSEVDAEKMFSALPESLFFSHLCSTRSFTCLFLTCGHTSTWVRLWNIKTLKRAFLCPGNYEKWITESSVEF